MISLIKIIFRNPKNTMRFFLGIVLFAISQFFWFFEELFGDIAVWFQDKSENV